MNRMQERYQKEVVPAMQNAFNYRNVMEIPKIQKIVVNIGLGEAMGNSKALDAAITDITTITDFTKGDKIVFGATAGAFTATKVDLSSVTTEQAAINALVAGSNSDVKWGVYNGNTYVVDDVDTGAVMAATDTVVKLSGVLDLTTSTFAANTLTFA